MAWCAVWRGSVSVLVRIMLFPVECMVRTPVFGVVYVCVLVRIVIFLSYFLILVCEKG